MDAIPEQWRPVAGYENLYEVSDHGNVRSITRLVQCSHGRYTRTIKGQPRRNQVVGRPGQERLAVMLSKNGKQRFRQVHQIVLESFIGPRPPGMVGCHNNGNAFDNRVENLRWDTPSENMRDTVRHGTNWEAQRTHCPQGHAYTPDNTRKCPRGKRRCRTCHRNDQAARYHRTKVLKPKAPLVRQHGTHAGYWQHYKRKEPVCEPCQTAYYEHRKQWRESVLSRSSEF